MHVYMDTSALFALYQRHDNTDAVELCCRDAKIIILRLALVEFHSALFRLNRQGKISLPQARTVIDAFGKDVGKYIIREISTTTCRLACDLMAKYSPDRNLRSLDAVQLAAVKALPRSLSVVYFITLDKHPLSEIAGNEGFDVKP